MKNYAPLPISFVKGKGCYLYSNSGKKYLDALAGIGVCCLGYSNSNISKVIEKQSKKILHTSNIFEIENQKNLAKNLCGITKMKSVFFCNSGSEANEAALKLSRLHGKNLGYKSPKVIIFNRSWHGRTLVTLAATDNTKAKQGFSPLPGGYIKCQFNNIKSVKNAIKKNTVSALIIEPIQGEGGIHVASKNFLKDIRMITKKNNILMIVDEVQTGVARTGKWLATQHASITPDIVTLAKGLGNGVPIGACLGNTVVTDLFSPGSHGSTFGGNPFVCAVANEVINIIKKKDLLKNANQMGSYLISSLKKELKHSKLVKEIRGKGLMVGIEIKIKGKDIVKDCLKEGVIINLTSKNVIRILPPLIINKNEIKYIVKTIKGVLQGYE